MTASQTNELRCELLEIYLLIFDANFMYHQASMQGRASLSERTNAMVLFMDIRSTFRCPDFQIFSISKSEMLFKPRQLYLISVICIPMIKLLYILRRAFLWRDKKALSRMMKLFEKHHFS